MRVEKLILFGAVCIGGTADFLRQYGVFSETSSATLTSGVSIVTVRNNHEFPKLRISGTCEWNNKPNKDIRDEMLKSGPVDIQTITETENIARVNDVFLNRLRNSNKNFSSPYQRKLTTK